MKNGVWRYGRWLGVLAALAVAVSIFACGGATSSTSTSTPTPASTPAPTVAPPPTPPSAPPIDILIDDDITWQELFDDFSPAEQDCIRTEVEGELDLLLGEQAMTGDVTDWQVSFFECLTPETARSVYASVLVAGMVDDETYDVTEQEIQCLSEWVEDADVHRLIRGAADDDLTVFGEMLSGVIPCLADFFMSEFLTGMGIDPGAMTDDEITCLNEWAAGYDWSNVMTAMVEEDLGILGELFPGLIGCAPGPFLALFFEDFSVDLDALTDEEKECLEDWLIDLDWDAVVSATTAATFAEEDEAYGLLAEAFGLLACVPDLDLDEIVDFGDTDDPADGFSDATRIGVGESIGGVIGAAYTVDLFELTADAGQFYQIDVALGTLEDSMLTIYDADGREVAYNDDYGGGSASRILWEAPATGDYRIFVSGFGTATGSYTLTVDPIEVTDDYPNSPDLSPTSITPGRSIEGVIDYDFDVDLFELEANAGESYRITVSLVTLNDSVLTIYDSEGREVAYNDDYGGGSASRIIWEAPATGDYYVEVSAFDSATGSYTLTVAPQ